MKKWLSILLAAVMFFQLLPMTVMAEDFHEETLTNVSFDTKVDASCIIGEDESKRDENVKHFRCSDGSYIAAVYNYPVHCQTEDGWQDLDLTLNEQKDENGDTVYKTKVGQSYEISVPEDIYNTPLSYSYNGNTVSMQYVDSLADSENAISQRTAFEAGNDVAAVALYGLWGFENGLQENTTAVAVKEKKKVKKTKVKIKKSKSANCNSKLQ